MRTLRITAKIVEALLDDEAKSTTEILDYVNQNTRHGATMGQVSNILSKSPAFLDAGVTTVKGLLGNAYENKMWIFVGLGDDVFTKDLSLNDDGSVGWR